MVRESSVGRPNAIHLRPDGFRVLDGYHIVTYSVSGVHLGTVSMPNSVSYRGFRFRPMGLLADGGLVVYPSVDLAYQAGWWGDDPVDHLPVVRLTERDASWSVDTLAVLDVTNDALAAGDPDQVGSTLLMVQPFRDSDRAIYRTESETVVLVRVRGLAPGQVDVTEVSAQGDTVWSRRLSFAPSALPPSHVEQFLEAGAANFPQADGSPGVLSAAKGALREALYVPQHYPPFRDLAMASNGELWMSTFERSDLGPARVWYTVPLGGPADEPLRRVLLPSSFSPHDATDTHVWGGRRDAYGVHYAVGLRLVPLEEESN